MHVNEALLRDIDEQMLRGDGDRGWQAPPATPIRSPLTTLGGGAS